MGPCHGWITWTPIPAVDEVVDTLMRQWVDWQEVCLSSGLLDLAFLWQRAEFAGATPPREAMWDAYLTTRGLRPDLDPRPVLAVAELLLLLVAWPSFLLHGSKHQQDLMTHRLGQLVDDELTGS